MPTPNIKCVVVGDGAVGKTCMLITYTTNDFPTKYVPTVFEHHSLTVVMKGQTYTLCLFDTAGQEEYDRLRSLTYANTDIFLLTLSCTEIMNFDIVLHHIISCMGAFADTPTIYTNKIPEYVCPAMRRGVPQRREVKLHMWQPEIRHYCPTAPLLLVGTKIDLRDDPNMVASLAKKKHKPKTPEQGEKLAKDIGAISYIECSSFTQVGLRNIFEEAIRVALDPPKIINKRKCLLL